MAELIIPGHEVEYRCACGMQFFDKRRGIQHAISCERALDELDEIFAAKESNPITSHVPADAEAWKWGRKRIAEGKPGFRRGRPA